METRKVMNGEITLYTSIKQLPVPRWNLLNTFVAQDIGIGSDVNSYGKHLMKWDTLVAAEDYPSARVERVNLHYNMHFIINGIDIKSRAFLCMVHSIDGQELKDLDNDEACEDALQLLYNTGVTVGDVHDVLEDLKKNLIGN
jgi:hypothetical protein